MKRIICITPVILFVTVCLNGQQFYPLDQPVLPPSPSSTSVMKFSAISPGLSSGIIPVNIQLLTLPGRSLSASVGLSYHASGVKVAETPGPVGSNWGLITGGLITRTMYSRPDEMNEGYLKWQELAGGDWTFGHDTIENFATGTWDSQPDVFHFTFPGHSGNFVFGLDDAGNTTIYTIPHSHLKIEWDEVYNEINKFVITVEGGTQYFFGKNQSESREAVESAESEPFYTGGTSYDYNSAWYLTQIISGSVCDTIDLYYSSCNEYIDYKYAEAHYEPIWVYPSTTLNAQTAEYGSKISYVVPILDSISSAAGCITCYHSGDRLDIPAGEKIDSLVLHNYLGDRIKSFQFGFSHSGTGADSLNRRLILSTLTEHGSDGTALPSYSFSYDTNTLPPRDSDDQDYWGYYNINDKDYLYTAYCGLPGAARETNQTLVKYGILEKIDLPKGGYKEFQYEPNYISKKRNYAISDDVRITDLVNADWDSIASLTPDTVWFYLPEQGNVQIDYTLTCPAAPYKGFIKIKNSSNTVVWSSPNLNIVDPQATYYHQVVTQRLNSGHYYICFDGFPDQSGEVEVQYKRYRDFAEPYLSSNAYVGGVRIKKVILNDGISSANNIETNYTYYDTINSTNSSGVLTDFLPNHHYEYRDDDGSSTALYFTRYARLNSLLFDGGYHIGYDAYQISQGTGNGMTMVSVISPSDEVNVSNEVFPFSYPISGEWKRGQVSGSYAYDSNGTIISESYQTYAVYDESGDANRTEIKGLKASVESTSGATDEDNINHISSWSHPVYQRNVSYPVDGGNSILYEQWSYFDKQDHMKLTRNVVEPGDGSTVETRIKYPMDYELGVTSDTKTTALSLMCGSKNMQGFPIESYTVRDGMLVSASCNTFSVSNGVVIPDTTFTYDLASPLVISSFDTSRVVSGKFVMDSNYRPVNAVDAIDPYNRVQEAHVLHGNPSFTLYGYNALYPIASFSNARSGEVAYSSFESEQKGSFSYSEGYVTTDTCAITGDKLLSSGTLSRTGLPAGSYFLTFWANTTPSVSVTNGTNTLVDNSSVNSQGMRYFQYKISANGATTVSLSSISKIDEVRIFPHGAVVSTRTYTPLIGITSQAGANSVPSYTSYDDFGRPEKVRDQDKFIIQEYQYNNAQ